MVAVVNYAHLSAAFRHDESAVQDGAAALAAAEADLSPEASDVLRTWLNDGVRGLRDTATLSDDVLATPEDVPEARAVALLQAFVAEQAEDDSVPGGTVIPAGAGGKEVKFDEKDWIGWASLAWPWLQGKVSLRRFLPPPERPIEIPNNADLALLGDWGTGLYGAPACAETIAAGQFDVVVHVGDVYYAGTKKEVRRNFLDHWRVPTGAISRACNSNHEMYSGGQGYFDLTLRDRRFGQSSSVWALANDQWLLIGLDTAYDDFQLGQGQVPWLRRFLDAHQGRRRVILFSHHQLFSLLSKQGTKLQDELSDLLQAGRIFAWYWGHEHRLVLYEQHEAWGLHGRCAGHSGYPYFKDSFGSAAAVALPAGHRLVELPATSDCPGGRVLDGPNPYVRGREGEYGPNGWMALRLGADGALTERALAPDGTELLTQTLR